MFNYTKFTIFDNNNCFTITLILYDDKYISNKNDQY